MDVIAGAEDLRARLAPARAAHRSIGLTPTMGALHDGHLSLVTRARVEADLVVASIFVNPLQFGRGEDLARYPRPLERDLELLRHAGTDVVFTPRAEDFTPPGALTTVRVRGLGDVLEGASRPGHFDGVATIVAKLLHVADPSLAYFGEKDFQQLAVIRRLVRDLHFDVRIVGCPIVRAADGLALSSRNAYLSPDERHRALALSRALFAAARAWQGDADAARSQLVTTLRGAPGVRLDYAEVVDPETLEPLEGVVDGPAQALVAAHVGAARLIDNIRLERAAPPVPGPRR